MQLKATDHLKRTPDGGAVVCRLERRNVLKWLGETYPVFLIVYDAQQDVAYWLYVQAHFRDSPRRVGAGRTVTVHVPVANRVTEEAVRRFAAAKVAVRPQMKGVRHYE